MNESASGEEYFHSSTDSLNDEENKKVDVMMDWIQTARLFNGVLRRHFVANYLSGCKFNVEKAQMKMVRYWSVRRRYSQWFRNRDVADENIKALINLGFLCLLKHRDSKGRSVVLIDVSRFDCAVYNANDIAKMIQILQDSCLSEKFKRANEWMWIVDVKKFPMSLVRQCTPKFLYQLTEVCLVNMPMLVKEVHFFNMNIFVTAIMKLIFMCFTPKLKQRFIFHETTSLLNDKLHLDCLPIEYGGSGGTLQENIDNFQEYLLCARDELLELAKTDD